MRVVLRRATGARGLLLAATGAALIATVLITGLVGYSRDVIAAGARSAVASAPPEERSLLLRGPMGASEAEATSRDETLRALLADGLGGRPAAVAAAGYAVGQEITSDPGSAVADKDGTVFAAVVFLDDLPDHADLISGSWASPDAVPGEVTLAEPAADALGVGAGDRIEIGDRRTNEVTEVVVTGVWRPRQLSDPYWLLTPGVATGVAPYSNSYGPIVVPRADFMADWAADASIAWIIRPETAGAELADLVAVERAAVALADGLPERVGLGDAGLVTTRIDQLVDRLGRADLVGRSALLTPVLLIIVLGGYALLLIALLLNEDRRAETALIRARGAARRQIAGLAAREAVMVVAPAAVATPLLVPALLENLNGIALLQRASVRLEPTLSAAGWAVSGAAAVGCLVAMVVPAMRRSGTYVEELASRSRPNRWAFAQRAGLDLLLVAIAVLAWTQLRQYSSPVVGTGADLGIDPLLSAGPTVAVLAGGVLALRILPRVTAAAERYVDRKHWVATMFGMWQAGRRPHAGPVLLLALSVAVSALALCLASTAERSTGDQADFLVGADLRLVELSGTAPPERAAQVAALPGAAVAAPVQRDVLRVGPDAVTTAVVAIDAEAAPDVVRYRSDLVDGSPERLFERLAHERGARTAVALPADVRRLTGTIAVEATTSTYALETFAVLAGDDGLYRRISLGTYRTGLAPAAFDVALPVDGRHELVGFDVLTYANQQIALRWTVADLASVSDSGLRTPVDLSSGEKWLVADDGRRRGRGEGGPGTLTGEYAGGPARTCTRFCGAFQGSQVDFSFLHPSAPPPVPVAATSEALHALRLKVGETAPLSVLGGQVPIKIVEEVTGVPGTPGTASALLMDLRALSDALHWAGFDTRRAHEYWVAAPADGAAQAAAAASRLPGVRVLDRRTIAEAASVDPYGVGARTGLIVAAGGAILLALVAIAVDVRATARRRLREMAVLNTLGASPRLLARALVAEQSFLAGMGVVVGLLVGIAVAATMAPLVILTPAADRPAPEPLLQVDWIPTAAVAGLLLLLAVGASGLVAATMRGRLTAAALRIGDE